MSKHTPGPWEKIGYDVWGNDAHKGHLSKMLASCRPDNGQGLTRVEEPAECIANARLISAAPEMYNELKRLIDTFGWDENHPAVKVIAKAERRE